MGADGGHHYAGHTGVHHAGTGSQGVGCAPCWCRDDDPYREERCTFMCTVHVYMYVYIHVHVHVRVCTSRASSETTVY